MFSVIIPLYNKEKSIERTIRSVLAQSFVHFEVVIVNDGSTDNSLEILNTIHDNRIRVISQRNQGVSSARNNGIKNAKFPWIAFLDGDDLWEKNHLSVVNEMINNYSRFKIFSTSFIRSDGYKFINLKIKDNIYIIDNFYSEYLSFLGLLWTCTTVIERKLLIENGGFNNKYGLGEDLDLFCRISKGNKIVKSNDVTAIYRIEAENRSDQGRYNMSKSFLNDIEFQSINSKDEKEFYLFWINHKLKDFIRNKDYKNALFLLRKYGLKILGYYINVKN